ncbi:hypothetical protein [Bacillus nitratireducens]|uniref:hypothetical protein n=1 Tax=Bacillus nitratireducens TaxID=2026193 RepID=UPI00387A24B1
MDKAKFEAIAKKMNITVYLLNLITNNFPTEPFSCFVKNSIKQNSDSLFAITIYILLKLFF